MDGERRVRMWARDRLFVNAVLRPDGTLVIEGQDLNRGIGNVWGAEYEYDLTVAAADVPRVVAALGGTEDDDVLALLQAHAAEIVHKGERGWLQGIGIEPGFWSRIGE